jgi:pimeloyl-ACP methyl ester carboxylesterase
MNARYVDRFLPVNGVRLHFQDWGEADKSAPLLMVHGVTMQSHAFDPVANLLHQRYHCIALDLRGHGDSERADPASYQYSVYAADVLALLDALEIKKTHYLGTSLGGRVAMTIGASQPDRLASLVLNDISPEPADAGIARILATFGGDKPPFPTVEAYVDQVVFAYRPWLRALPMETVAKTARWSLREVEGGFRPKFDPHVLGRVSVGERAIRAKDMLWQGFRNVTCPMLLLRGEQSDIVSTAAVRLMQAARPQLQVVEIPGVGHVPALTEPAARKALERFFP